MITQIVQLITEHALANQTHPNDAAKLYASLREVDMEVGKLMVKIQQFYRDNKITFVGGGC